MLDITVHTRSLAYDLQLPCTIPVQRITADVIAWINAYASDDSGLDPHRKYSLETTTGESLQESGTLAALNIRHGTHLHLREVDDAPRPIPVIEDIGTYLEDNHGSGRSRATFGGIRSASANIANVVVPIILAVAVVVPPVPPSAVTAARLVVLAAALIAIVGSFMGLARGWITQQRLAGILLGGTAVTACGALWLLHDPAPATTAEIILGTLFLAVAVIHIFSPTHRTILLAGEIFLLSSMLALGISPAGSYFPSATACYVVMGLTVIVFVNASPISVILAGIPTPKFPSKTNTYVIDVIRGHGTPDLPTVREKTRYAVEYIAGIITGLGAFHAAAAYIVISHSGGRVLALCLASAFPIIYITATFNYTLASKHSALWMPAPPLPGGPLTWTDGVWRGDILDPSVSGRKTKPLHHLGFWESHPRRESVCTVVTLGRPAGHRASSVNIHL